MTTNPKGELELQKLEAEVKLLQEETQTLRRNRNFEWIKYILTIMGAGILFFLITRPESVLNRKSSKDQLARERAQLVIDVLANEDPNKALLSLYLIKSTYSDGKKFLG